MVSVSPPQRQLMESLRKKLGVLREAQRGLQEDIRANTQLGEEVRRSHLTAYTQSLSGRPPRIDSHCGPRPGEEQGDIVGLLSAILSSMDGK